MTDKALPELTLPAASSSEEIVTLLSETIEALAGDEGYRDGLTRAVPGARLVYGVRVPALRALAGQVIKAYAKNTEMIVAIAEGCWLAGSREHRVLGILILAGHKRLSPAQRWDLGTRYLPEVGDWETCDQLCMGLLGQALVDAPEYMERIETWVDDPNFWVRRAALASTVVLRRSKAAPEIRKSLDERALNICLRLLDDEQHYVRKAVDWAVREVLRRDYALGKAWLLKCSETSLSPVARSTLKKAAKKLLPADQESFLKNLS